MTSWKHYLLSNLTFKSWHLTGDDLHWGWDGSGPAFKSCCTWAGEGEPMHWCADDDDADENVDANNDEDDNEDEDDADDKDDDDDVDSDTSQNRKGCSFHTICMIPITMKMFINADIMHAFSPPSQEDVLSSPKFRNNNRSNQISVLIGRQDSFNQLQKWTWKSRWQTWWRRRRMTRSGFLMRRMESLRRTGSSMYRVKKTNYSWK